MENLMELLKILCEAQGTSGDEDAAAAQAAAAELGFCDTVEIDSLGGVHAFWGDPEAERQVMLDAHLDSIGLTVTGIDPEGFLTVASVGGMDRRVLTGARVLVFGRETLPGVVSCLPPHLVEGGAEKAPEIADLAIDVGLTKEEAERLVAPGDRVLVPASVCALQNGRVTGTALDDRAGCATVILAAKEIVKASPKLGLHVVLSSKEETGGQGAQVQSFRHEPTEALVVDVTFATQEGVSAKEAMELGKGPAIGYAPLLDKGVTDGLKAAARRAGIPFQMEIMGRGTGTNADEIAVSRRGVRCGLVSIPQRNMHTPVEVCDLKDIEQTAKLLAAYVLGE